MFAGTKTFILSTANEFGGKNLFLAIAYFVVGSCCLLTALIFLIRKCTKTKVQWLLDY